MIFGTHPSGKSPYFRQARSMIILNAQIGIAISARLRYFKFATFGLGIIFGRVSANFGNGRTCSPLRFYWRCSMRSPALSYMPLLAFIAYSFPISPLSLSLYYCLLSNNDYQNYACVAIDRYLYHTFYTRNIAIFCLFLFQHYSHLRYNTTIGLQYF